MQERCRGCECSDGAVTPNTTTVEARTMKVKLHIHPIDLVVGYSVLHSAYVNVQRLCDIVYFLVVLLRLGVQESEHSLHVAAAAAEGVVKMQRWKLRI